MNQSKVLREKKQSLNKLSTERSGVKSILADLHFLPTPIKSTNISTGRHEQGQYLIGWGALPVQNNERQIVALASQILQCAAGEQHAVYMTASGEVYGIGHSNFGQLGVHSTQKLPLTPIFQNRHAKKLYSTQFCTFIQTHSNQIYASGLNNRDQLGLESGEDAYNFKKIDKISSPPQIQSSASKSRLQGIKYHPQSEELQKSENYEITETNETNRSRSLLKVKEQVITVTGGPYHTIALTNRGRIFYSGNLYTSKCIRKNEHVRHFIELSLGKITLVKSSLTCFVFMTEGKGLFLMGLVSVNCVYDEPIRLFENDCLVDFAVEARDAFGVTQNGDLLCCRLDNTKSVKRISKHIGQVKEIHAGLDYCIAISASGDAYGRGNICCSQVSQSSSKPPNQFHPLSELKRISLKNIHCSTSFVLALTPQISIEVIKSQEISSNYSKGNQSLKITQIIKENKLLKELLSTKPKKSMKVQTEKESKFDLNMISMKARTFQSGLQIPFEELKMGKQISEGGYGVIYEAQWRKTTVAVKLFKIDGNSQNSIKDFISECHAMEVLRHPNIVMFLGACTKGPNFAIVLEYCQRGNLWQYLQKSSNQISWNERRNIALQISRGMNYLHDRSTPILHRDLKSLNILLDCNSHVKLADFGWTKGLQNYMTGKIGTYQWMAPEVISAQQYTEKADIFSFGIILWEILSREAPYRNIPGIQVAQEVLNSDLRPAIPKKAPQVFVQLMKSCWDKHASARPGFNQIINILEEMRFA